MGDNDEKQFTEDTSRSDEKRLTEDLRKSVVHTRPDPSTGPPDIIDLNLEQPELSQNENQPTNTSSSTSPPKNDET